MKRYIWLIIFLCACPGLCAQTEADVWRYSRLSNVGSARLVAMGGAFGALGGDISSWNINPAGIGVSRRPEVAYTSLLDFSRTESGNFLKKNTTYLIGSIGGVLAYYDDEHDWRAFNVGLSYSGQNNFNRKTERAVNNSSSSLTDVYAVQSQGWKPEELGIFDAGPFYDTYLLYQTGDEVYHSILETADPQPELVNQHISIKEDGYQGEFALAFGTNYRDKLYMGTMLGVQLLRYKMRSAYTETASENAPSLLDNFTFNEYQKTKGVGINLKFGVIYRPVSQIRLGVAIHSPAWFALKHTLETAVHSCFTTETDPSIGRESADYLISTKDYGEYYDPYEYLIRLNTPWRAVFSFATVLGKRLILSMDYEYVNYRAAKYKHPVSWMYKVAAGKDLASWEYTDEDDDEDEDTWEEDKMRDLSELIDYGPINEAIKDIYRSAHHFRAGAEIRVTSVVSLRGGYGFQNSPYAGDSGRNNQIRSVSGGLGLNFGLIYGDISYARHRSENESRFYDYENIRALPVHNQLTNHEVRLTVGVRFSSDGGGIPGIIQEIF